MATCHCGDRRGQEEEGEVRPAIVLIPLPLLTPRPSPHVLFLPYAPPGTPPSFPLPASTFDEKCVCLKETALEILMIYSDCIIYNREGAYR